MTGALALFVASTAGCTFPAENYEIEDAQGSLEPFFIDPIACSCTLNELRGDITFGCAAQDVDTRDALGWEPLFSVPIPAVANVRERSFVEVVVDDDAWPNIGFGRAAAEIEYNSEVYRAIEGDVSSTGYYEFFVWTLDLPAQRVCAAESAGYCRDIAAGRLVGARFGCTSFTGER